METVYLRRFHSAFMDHAEMREKVVQKKIQLKDFIILKEAVVYKEYEISYGFIVCSTDLHAVFKTEKVVAERIETTSSAIRPVSHTSEIPVPYPPSSLDDIRSDSEDEDTLPHQDESSSDFSVDGGPQPFSQSDFNDLVRDLGLSKDGAELLWSRLKNKNLLTPGTSFSWYKHREKEFTQFFCNDVQGLRKCFDIEYDPSEWRLFIDSSKTSLKAVLLL
ncbi:hypothetical protein AVEN_213367-1 [Araneus ventricosus]|uniref:Uncharacterized protein n=1 Tax=Araneus ventricosus TaxID=182803 RepID=A0A4Y2HN99_ARAVE|nr:hypothetical protein AVEN_213367-1 [Araneus ventricosus]